MWLLCEATSQHLSGDHKRKCEWKKVQIESNILLVPYFYWLFLPLFPISIEVNFLSDFIDWRLAQLIWLKEWIILFLITFKLPPFHFQLHFQRFFSWKPLFRWLLWWMQFNSSVACNIEQFGSQQFKPALHWFSDACIIKVNCCRKSIPRRQESIISFLTF